VSDNKIVKTENGVIEKNQLTIPLFDTTQGCRVIMTGTAWNNTVSKEEAKIKVAYAGPAFSSRNQQLEASTSYVVDSGSLSFASVPEMLAFKKENIHPINQKNVIDREQEDWTLSVADLRGTNPIDGDVPRTDWEITALAQPFVANQTEMISPDVLGIAFVKDGQENMLSNTEEVLIEHHSVKNEMPKEHPSTQLTWSKDNGFHAISFKERALNPEIDYQAAINLELRQAP
jgi:hypothetical protein